MTKRLALAAAVILAIAGFVGCGGSPYPRTPNTVADVGDYRITTAELDRVSGAVAQVLQPAGEQGQISSRAVAATLIGGQVARQLSTRTRTPITAAERAQLIQQAGGPEVAELDSQPAGREFLDAYLAPVIMQQKLGPQRYLELSQQIPVVTNPAYGTWDYTTNGLDGINTGSLSVPFSTAAVELPTVQGDGG